MRRLTAYVLALLLASAAGVATGAANKRDEIDVRISGTVSSEDGPLRGVTVTLFSSDERHSVSVYSQEDGTFSLPPSRLDGHRLRARLLGFRDAWIDIEDESSELQHITLAEVSGRELQGQRVGNDLLSLIEFDNEEDALSFRMMCTYCHQVGTLGFRSPEEPVDWEVMITRMDGFHGLPQHIRQTLLDRVLSIWGVDAEDNWPEYEPPPIPANADLSPTISEWDIGLQDVSRMHDMEMGNDGIAYAVDINNDAIVTLDPRTGESEIYTIPGGKEWGSTGSRTKGPHSIEMDTDGNMWLTLSSSGEMALFNVETKEWRLFPGHPTRARGGYPHTLRFAENGHLWWTDAALGVLSLDPTTWNPETGRYDVKHYVLPDKGQVRGTGRQGESRGVTPYGIDTAPNGHVWYSKLNGQRVGRVAPELADDHPDQIIEWKPPVHGPRRLHVAPNGIVWVPGWASGNIASFEPESETWKVYPLPHGLESMPYALNIHPDTGHVWVCGTNTDSLLRFDPKTEEFFEYRLPTRVTYTREIEFDARGNIWTPNSNIPTRHVEDGWGSVIRLALD